MPLGGLLPYPDTGFGDSTFRIGDQDPLRALLGPNMQEAPRGAGVAPPAAPSPGIMQRLAVIAPQLVTAFSAGQAVRQRDPRALSSILAQFIQSQEDARRIRLAEEAQRLREEREARLAEIASARESRLVATEEARGQREAAEARRRAQLDLQNLQNQILDDARSIFGPGVEGAPLEEFITQQVSRLSGMEGADPAALRALLMAQATLANRPEPEQPVIVVDPDRPPSSVPRGSRVITRPRPERPTTRAYTTTDEQGNVIRIVEDEAGREISRRVVGRRPATQANDPISRILSELEGEGAGAASSTTPTGTPTPRPPQIGERRLVRGRLAEWDGKGWVAVR